MLIKSLKTNKQRFVQYVRLYSSKKLLKDYDINKIRNIGILAHIDAGKTTTTERMLFYSGTIQQMGEVHHGNTVTDFMPQERDRGITIRSAAVTFPWKNHQFNLIDTPGHIDFTMEVEQSMNVLDGAVVVLDGSAGVEAQTLTVWRQANRYNIPRVVYVNKMDRGDADLDMCCKQIERKLDIPTVCLHLPVKENDKFLGIIDILTLQKKTWFSNTKDTIITSSLTESDGQLWITAKEARNNVIDRLSSIDDGLANTIIESESLDNISTPDIVSAVRKSVLLQKVVPVLCGSSYKNIGVQPLMDSIVLYLPSPNERNKHFRMFEGNLCARAFKILHDKQRGALVFFRIYSGSFAKNQKIYNVQQDLNEQSNRLLIAYADDYEEIDSLQNGNIAVVTGLKKTMTGDLICSSSSSAERARKKMQASDKLSQTVDSLFNLGANIPEPVFFCSIEPPSLAYQNALDQALIELEREDPSLRVTHDNETGQTVLAGMGELHLEIIKDRIMREYKIDADLGPLQISYREAPLQKVTKESVTETRIGSTKHSVQLKMSLVPLNEHLPKIDLLKLDRSSEAASQLASIHPKHLAAVKQGVQVGLAHGPKIGAQMIKVQLILHELIVGRGTSETIIAAAATQCLQKLFSESDSSILEPIMDMEIVTPDDYLPTVLADLNRRRTVIQNVSLRGSNKIILTETPLSELMGYSTTLRTITSGTGTFAMEFQEYRMMSAVDESKAIAAVRGF